MERDSNQESLTNAKDLRYLWITVLCQKHLRIMSTAFTCLKKQEKMCCIDSGVANSNNECKPPKSLIDMTLVRFTKAGNTLCQRNVIPNTNKCCIDLSTVVEANDCPKGSTLTALSSFNPKSQRVQYNICLNSLIKGTKNCCMFPIR